MADEDLLAKLVETGSLGPERVAQRKRKPASFKEFGSAVARLLFKGAGKVVGAAKTAGEFGLGTAKELTSGARQAIAGGEPGGKKFGRRFLEGLGDFATGAQAGLQIPGGTGTGLEGITAGLTGVSATIKARDKREIAAQEREEAAFGREIKLLGALNTKGVEYHTAPGKGRIKLPGRVAKRVGYQYFTPPPDTAGRSAFFRAFGAGQDLLTKQISASRTEDARLRKEEEKLSKQIEFSKTRKGRKEALKKGIEILPTERSFLGKFKKGGTKFDTAETALIGIRKRREDNEKELHRLLRKRIKTSAPKETRDTSGLPSAGADAESVAEFKAFAQD